jgi:hypothetical protein
MSRLRLLCMSSIKVPAYTIKKDGTSLIAEE